MTITGDPVAARVHDARAERHYEAAERLRRNGLPQSAAEAEECARREERMADALREGPRS